MTRSWIAILVVLAAACHESDDPPSLDGPDDGGISDGTPFLDAITLVDGAGIDAPPPNFDAPPSISPNTGFVTPTAVTKANTFTGGVWTEVGNADWSCLGTPSADQPSTGTIALSGMITDFQTGNGVGAASITAWSTSPAATVGTATSDNAGATRGNYTMTLGMLPGGTRRYGFTITAASYTTTRLVGRYFPPGAAATADLDAVSEATMTALPAFIGITRDPTKGAYLGSMRDCQGRAVSNAVVGISSVPTTYTDAGGTTFYFSAGSNSSLPVRHNVAPVMNKDGLYVVLNVPPATSAVVQVWGFRTAGELASGTMTLLGEIITGVDADMIVVANLEPRRS